MHSVFASSIFLLMDLPCFIVAVLKYISPTKRLNSLLSLVSLQLCPARFHCPIFPVCYLHFCRRCRAFLFLFSFPPSFTAPICHCHPLLPFAITYILRSFLPSPPLSLCIPPSRTPPRRLAPALLPYFPCSPSIRH